MNLLVIRNQVHNIYTKIQRKEPNITLKNNQTTKIPEKEREETKKKERK